MDVTLLPAHEQARLISAGELGSRELLGLIADRYAELHPQVNAVIVERLDQAFEAAGRADDAVAAGEHLGRFHGVPVTIKEVIDWVGTPSTWGDPRHVGNLATHNATALDRLLREGAIVWGKTNVPLDLAEWQTFNRVYGRTNNPYALDRTPGGSSGGSAAALAVGYAGLEVGSDIGGSLRFPAHYCGVFSHKPSFGAVSQAGHAYPGHDAPVDINVVGPMARSAVDLDRAMRVLSDLVLHDEARNSLSEFTVGVMFENPLGGEQDAEMTTLLYNAVDQLRSAGLRIDERPIGIDLGWANRNYLVLNYAAMALVERGDRPDPESNGARLSHQVWLQLNNERERIRNQWQEYFDSVDLLLMPVTAGPAPFHQTDVPFAEQTIEVNGREVSNQEQWVWAGLVSGAYLPSTVVPVAQTTAGLPVGMQIVAPFASDLSSIRLAELVERELGGFTPPTLIQR